MFNIRNIAKGTILGNAISATVIGLSFLYPVSSLAGSTRRVIDGFDIRLDCNNNAGVAEAFLQVRTLSPPNVTSSIRRLDSSFLFDQLSTVLLPREFNPPRGTATLLATASAPATGVVTQGVITGSDTLPNGNVVPFMVEYPDIFVGCS